jgi:MOSC domain-containing protein YiiM
MHLTSVNVGQRRTQQKGNALETTGIYKTPTQQSVQVTSLGLEGDFIASLDDHGGPDQAVYVYGASDYKWWSSALGKDLAPGTFGENLTISDLESARFNIGDRLHVGSVVLEVTAPRTPCSTLARRMGDPLFVKKYARAERPGLYCRVLEAGSVKTGDFVELEHFAGETVALLDIFRDHYRRDKQEVTLRRFLRAPIAIRTRADLERDLRKLLEATWHA